MNTTALRYSTPAVFSDAKTDETILPSIADSNEKTDETILPSTADSNERIKIARPLSPEIKKNLSVVSTGNIDNLKQIEDPNQGCCNWFQ